MEGRFVRIICLPFFLLLIHTFCLFRCIELFPYCSISEHVCLIFHLLSFLCYLDSVSQLLGSYGGHVLVLDPVKRANCGRELRASSLKRKDSCLHHPQTLFVKRRLVRQLYLLFFFFWLTLFVLLDVLSPFHIVPYRNLTVWFFICCLFCVISILVVSYWGPMEATLLSWILSSLLNCARQLRTSNLEHKDCCSHHLQTWFVEGNVVRQLGIF